MDQMSALGPIVASAPQAVIPPALSVVTSLPAAGSPAKNFPPLNPSSGALAGHPMSSNLASQLQSE